VPIRGLAGIGILLVLASSGHAQTNAPDTAGLNAALDAFRDQIRRCWVPPAGQQGIAHTNPIIRLRLKLDGTLDGDPVLLNRSSEPEFPALAESALKALKKCQPFRLPAQAYSLWKETEIVFNPSEMGPPPKADNVSSDCTNAPGPYRRLVCADAEIKQWDGKLFAAHVISTLAASGPEYESFAVGQTRWESTVLNPLCGLLGKGSASSEQLLQSKGCVIAAIKERIAKLRAGNSPPRHVTGDEQKKNDREPLPEAK
jgi:hypothetical protein